MLRTTLLALLLLVAGQTAMAIEEPDYELLAKTEDFEIRRYAPYIFAEVDVTGSTSAAGNSAFRILAGYIFGKNIERQTMSMTAPVESRAASSVRMNMTAPVESRPGSDGTHTYAFVMERKYTLDTLPKPLDSRIRIATRPSRIMAVRRYSGGWSEGDYQQQRAALLAALDDASIDVVGEPAWARYDSPLKPWFLRRNEVMIEIEWRDGVTAT